MKINVEMTEKEYSDFMEFRSGMKIGNKLFDSLSSACSMFLGLFDCLDIKGKYDSLTVESMRMLQIVMAKCKFSEVLEGMKEALSKQETFGKIDEWYFQSYLYQLEQICKGKDDCFD